MQSIKLTRPDGTFTTVQVNKTVLKFLWDNYSRLGFNEIENLTLRYNY